MGLKYFPEIDEPHMQRTQRRSRFAYLFDLDEEPSQGPMQIRPKSASNKFSAKPGNSDESVQKSNKPRSIIRSTIDLAKKGLQVLRASKSDDRSKNADQKSNQEFVKLYGSGGPWTSTEILQDQSRRFSHEYPPPGGELRRSKAIRLRASTAHLKERRASLNQKLARREREYQYLSRQTVIAVWP